jgi:hypothetical protein
MMHPVSLHKHPAGLFSAPSRKLPDTKHACPLLLLAWSPNHDALSRCRNVSVFDTWREVTGWGRLGGEGCGKVWGVVEER